jgi:hypothetical protein
VVLVVLKGLTAAIGVAAALLGGAAMAKATIDNYRRAPLEWSKVKVLFHPHYWLEPYGSRYGRGLFLFCGGVLIASLALR